MNYGDTARLLATISTIDNRRLDETTVQAWHGVLGDLDIDECMEAVRRHFAKSTDWLMPAHIRATVAAIREQRRPHHESLSLPSRFEDDPDRADRIQRGIAKVSAALSIVQAARPKAVEATEKPPPTRSDQIRAAALKRAVGERGGSVRVLEPAPLRDRRIRTTPTDYATVLPELGAIRTCTHCPGDGARYTDDPAGVGAHRAVFGHTPTDEGAA